MATVCSSFLLNPTSNSVLGEHDPVQSRGRCRLPGTLMWGRTWAPWGGGTDEGWLLQPSTVCARAWAAGGLQVRAGGNQETEELWKWFFFPWGWGSDSTVAGAGIWDETSNLSFAAGGGDVLGPTVHQAQLPQTELSCLISDHGPVRDTGLYQM